MSIARLPNAYLSRDIYRSCIDETHFLIRLEALFDWHALAAPLLALGKNDHGGRPRHRAVLMLKMLFVSFLFDLSDRETEFTGTNNLLVKYFLGLAIDEKAPDHTSLCRFRDAVLLLQEEKDGKKGQDFFLNLFRSLVAEAKKKGISSSVVVALDATHTFANVDEKASQDLQTPRDPDASWGCKGNETRTTASGEKVQIPKYFLGYKAHLAAETGDGLITGFHATTGRMSDLDGGDHLMHRTMTKEERRNTQVLLADKGYGCPVWINLLEKHTGIMTAFSLPLTMTKRGEHQEKWKTYEQNQGRNAFKKDRYVIERVNADLKDNHGLRRCRYLGLAKYKLQLAMASVCHNIKIYVRLLTGARLRPV